VRIKKIYHSDWNPPLVEPGPRIKTNCAPDQSKRNNDGQERGHNGDCTAMFNRAGEQVAAIGFNEAPWGSGKSWCCSGRNSNGEDKIRHHLAATVGSLIFEDRIGQVIKRGQVPSSLAPIP
jgi:hypothetical protein